MSVHSNMGHSNGYFEPELVHCFLPGCKNCGGAHPLARKPQMPEDVCPDCKEPVQAPGPAHTEKAVLGGWSPSIIMARAALAVGKGLSKLAKRI